MKNVKTQEEIRLERARLMYKAVAEGRNNVVKELTKDPNNVTNIHSDTENNDILVKDAFVSNSSEKNESEEEITLASFLKDITIPKYHEGTPETGFHLVHIDGEPEIRKGKDGAYITFHIVEDESGLSWKSYVNASDLSKMMIEISYYNNGLLANMSGVKALQTMQKKNFSCWTDILENGSLKTWFNEEKFKKYIYYRTAKIEQAEMRKIWEKEKADKEKSAKEAAELTRTAK